MNDGGRVMKREELTRYLDELLQPGRFRDYCPNGLQVEGNAEFKRIWGEKIVFPSVPLRRLDMTDAIPVLEESSAAVTGDTNRAGR